MEERAQSAWNFKADSLLRSLAHEPQTRTEQFARVANIAGIGETDLLKPGRIDLARLMKLRQSDELGSFRVWLRSAGSKSNEEIRDRVCSLRAKIGNAIVSPAAKAIRFLVTQAPGVIPFPQISIPLSLSLGALDSFLLERITPRDAVFSVLLKDYPALFH
jgi:hypothetical protein